MEKNEKAAQVSAAVSGWIAIGHEKNELADLLKAQKELPIHKTRVRITEKLRRVKPVVYLFRLWRNLQRLIAAGALWLLSSTLLLVFIPGIFIFLFVMLLSALCAKKQSNQKMKTRLAKKRVYLLLFQPQGEKFYQENLRSFAALPDSVVLLISPFWISSQGLCDSRRFYFTVRKEEENIYLLRRYYFFSLRKNVLQSENCVYIY